MNLLPSCRSFERSGVFGHSWVGRARLARVLTNASGSSQISKVFVSRPYSCDPQGSRAFSLGIARRLALGGHLPLAPQIYFPQFLDESTERDLALKLCLQLLALADEVHVYGEPSEGMRMEIAEAHRLGIPVVPEKLP